MDSAFATRAPTAFEATPLVSEGVMYLSTPLGRVFALDPLTGERRWTFDPKVDRGVQFGDFTNRGVSLWKDPTAAADARCATRIFVAPIDARLIALDAATGLPCDGFGVRGTVNLLSGLRNAPERPSEYEETSPPTVINGRVIVGSAIADNNRTDAASGEVRAFDARTGALAWTWHTIPQDSADPGYRTWRDASAHRTGAANAWSIFAADPARDLVFIPTGSPSVDYFGGERKGQNLYGNSITAVRVSTGMVAWHFQTVHHDLWDYDNASPPALITVQRQGQRVDAVVQATKTGQLFVLDRDTGTPVFRVEERPVPASDIPNEEAWPTQPFSVELPPLSPSRLSADDAWGMTGADRAECRAQIASLRNEGPFTPPSEKGSLVLPGNIGGAHWGGVSYDSATETIVVPVNRVPSVVTLLPTAVFDKLRVAQTLGERIGTEYTRMRGTPYVMKREILSTSRGSLCSPPPFGALTAISLRTKTVLWSVPLGTTEHILPAEHRPIPDTLGMVNLGGPITTASGLVFIGASPDRYFRAFDSGTGRELWKVRLPAAGKATPMTYLGRDGRQYVVIAAGGDGKAFGRSDELIAFALPRIN